MIDWLSLIVPCDHSETVCGGRILVVEPDGSFRESLRWLTASGSAESTVQVRTHEMDGYKTRRWLYVSGNPAKWFQGHNLAGTTDPALAYAFGRSVLASLGLQDRPDHWWVNRVDVAAMYDLGTSEDCDAWLRAAERSAVMKYRGRGSLDSGSLYYGKRSRRVSLKAYNKGREIIANAKHFKVSEDGLKARLTAWAQGKLRLEVVARRMYLDDKKLRLLSRWNEQTAWEIFVDQNKRVNLHMTQAIDPSDLRTLTNHQRGVYQMWLAGVRLEQIMARSTFYRHRSQFLALGVDLAAEPPTPGNVIPLLRELVAVPAEIPDWMPIYRAA